jgi:hypothetical protein
MTDAAGNSKYTTQDQALFENPVATVARRWFSAVWRPQLHYTTRTRIKSMAATDARWQFIAVQRELRLDETVEMPPPAS